MDPVTCETCGSVLQKKNGILICPTCPSTADLAVTNDRSQPTEGNH